MNNLQKKQMLKKAGLALIAFVTVVLLGFLGSLDKASAQEQKLKNTQNQQIKVDKAAKASQDRVTKTAEETRTIVDEYRATLRKVENTKIYNEQLRKLIASQDAEMISIAAQIEEIKNTNKEIFPLRLRMIANMEEFITLDVPFLMMLRSR